mgnify:FL=1
MYSPLASNAMKKLITFMVLFVFLTSCSWGTTGRNTSKQAVQPTQTSYQRGTKHPEPANSSPRGINPVPTVTPKAGQQQRVKPRNLVLFQSDKAIWQMDLSGGGAEVFLNLTCRELLLNPRTQDLTCIQPSKSKSTGLLSIDLETHKSKEIVSDNVIQAAWSQDGRYLAYTVTRDSNHDKKLEPYLGRSLIYIKDIVRGSTIRVGPGIDPTWDPRKPQLFFATSRSRQGNKIMSYSLASRAFKEVIAIKDLPKDLSQYGVPFATKLSLLRHPSISYDGSRLAISAYGSTALLITLDLHKPDKNNIHVEDFAPESSFEHLVWGPNSHKLAYEVLTPSGLDQLAVLDVSTGNREIFGDIRSGIGYTEPAWAPDGKHLIATRTYRNRAKGIYMITLGNQRIRILKPGYYSKPLWIRVLTR